MDESYITIAEHLWWLIFSKFENSVALLKLRGVSSALETLIEDYFEKNKIWKKICEENIKFWAYKILATVDPNKLINLERPLSSEDWKKVFLHYCKWRSSFVFTSLTAEIGYPLEEEITYSTVWNDMLITGTNSGKIFLSDIVEDQEKIGVGFENKHHVKELKVWLAEEDLEIVVVLSQNKSLKFFDLTDQDETPLPTVLKFHSTNICVSVDHRLFAENNFRVTEYNSHKKKIHFCRTCDVSIFIKSSMSDTKFLSMYSENDLLVVMIKSNDQVQILKIKFPRDIHEDPEMLDIKFIEINNISKQNNIIVPLMPIKELGLIFCGNELVVCSSLFSDSDKECKYFKLSGFKNEIITSTAMNANILLVGWKSGLFSKIYLDRLEDFINFNNPPHPKSDTFRLCTEPIVAINFAECLSTSYVILTTKNTQYFISNQELFEELGSPKRDHDDDNEDNYNRSPKKRRLSV